MGIGARLFLGLLCIAGVGIWLLADWVGEDLRPRYLEAVEATMVDAATILAAIASEQAADGRIDPSRLARAMADARARTFEARIYRVVKHRLEMDVSVTDAAGIVVYDSGDPSLAGADHSRWNDVHLTLRGRYGARSTRSDPDDPRTSVLHVAMPVRDGGRTIGVLSVRKPADSVTLFMEEAKRNIVLGALVIGGAVALLAAVATAWITVPIRRLRRYAEAVRDGRRPPPPRLAGELRALGAAFEEMRDALEGRRYVERYVQTLTHEMKSPLSAIGGAAELLDDDLPPADRARFVGHVRAEAERLRALVDRLLELAALESRKALREVAEVELRDLVREVAESLRPVAERRGVRLAVAGGEPVAVRGERFLLRQALANLVHNAIDFSAAGGEVAIAVEARDGAAAVIVEDAGPGIPGYARERVFERFYSLPRPDGAKGTGLGLTFVREVAELHGGRATLAERLGGGTRAELEVPR